MRELNEKELALVAGGGQSEMQDDIRPDPNIPDFPDGDNGNDGGKWSFGSTGGYSGVTWTSGDGSIRGTAGGNGTPSVGIGIEIATP